MRDYTKHNFEVIKKKIAGNTAKFERATVIPVFMEVAEAIFDWLDFHLGYYQNQTYNLRDSTGVGVFKEGVLVDWIHNPTPTATEPTPYLAPGAALFEWINGRELLNKALLQGEYSNIAYYSLVLYSTAPYGIEVEDGGGKRGTGWWSEGLVPYVKERFITTIAKYNKK